MKAREYKEFFTDNKGNKVKRITSFTLKCIGYVLGANLALFAVWLIALCCYACQ